MSFYVFFDDYFSFCSAANGLIPFMETFAFPTGDLVSKRGDDHMDDIGDEDDRDSQVSNAAVRFLDQVQKTELGNAENPPCSR